MTAWDADAEQRVFDQHIADAALEMIASAHTTVIADFFLWNRWLGQADSAHRPLADAFAAALRARAAAEPAADVLVMSDPINAAYDRRPADALRNGWRSDGVHFVLTDLNRLRNSNRFYTWCFEAGRGLATALPFVESLAERRWLPNPFQPDGTRFSGAQAARLLRFKANHRKVLVCDDADGRWHVLVTSMNPHDGSSGHSNAGLIVEGAVALDAARSELDCMEWSLQAEAPSRSRADARKAIARVRRRVDGAEGSAIASPGPGEPWARWLTEGAIRDKTLAMLKPCHKGDTVRLAMFYLSDRGVVSGLKNAAAQGADVRIVLDPNKDAFGRAKNGVPNRPVAAELIAFALEHDVLLQIRWADTHGEQFHTKALSVTSAQGSGRLLCGSANFTRRNLADLNLEACVAVSGTGAATAFNDAFDAWWRAPADAPHVTVPYEHYAEQGLRLWTGTLTYRFGEWSGMSTY